MIRSFLIFGLTVTALWRADTSSPHADDSIYILRGDENLLRRFQANIGDSWLGGTALDSDPSDGTISYWAFAKRTAPEARAFLMPAAMSGLDLKIEQYDESQFFPALRKQLDGVTGKCRLTSASLWIRPTGYIQIERDPTLAERAAKCLRFELSRAGLKFLTSDNRSN